MKLEQTLMELTRDSNDILHAMKGKNAGKYTPESFIVKSINNTRIEYNYNDWTKERFMGICRVYNLSEIDLKHKLLEYQLEMLK